MSQVDDLKVLDEHIEVRYKDYFCKKCLTYIKT